MEPNNPIPQKEPEGLPGDPTRPTYPDLHAEGVDIVSGSGVAEDNEFSKGSLQESVDRLNTTSEPLDIPLPPTPPVPKPVEVAPEKIEPMNDPSIKPLRTFKSDAEEAVKYQNVSTIDIAIAEQKRREARSKVQVEEKKPSSPGIFVVIAILVIALIGGGWYYWFTSSQDTVEKTPIPTTVKTIVPSTKGSTVYLEPKSDPLILISAKLAASNAGLGNIYTIIPTNTSTSTTFAPISQVFRNTKMPDRLKRSLSDTYMVGTYIYDANSPFIIVKNTFFQNAFSGMLDWEKNMRTDLLPLIRVTHAQEENTATSTTFTDTVVANIDTRVLKNEAGDSILMYAFADKDTIVISTNTSALKYVLEKLLTVRTIQ